MHLLYDHHCHNQYYCYYLLPSSFLCEYLMTVVLVRMGRRRWWWMMLPAQFLCCSRFLMVMIHEALCCFQTALRSALASRVACSDISGSVQSPVNAIAGS